MPFALNSHAILPASRAVTVIWSSVVSIADAALNAYAFNEPVTVLDDTALRR